MRLLETRNPGGLWSRKRRSFGETNIEWDIILMIVIKFFYLLQQRYIDVLNK
jgi:hypothetical protein